MADETYIKKSSHAYHGILGQVERIDSLALSFRNTGNHVLADELFSIAHNIEQNAKSMDDAMSEAVHSYIKYVHEAGNNRIKAVLAGIEMRERKEVESDEE